MVRLSPTFFVILSFVLTALTIANAFLYKKQFYPAVVYLTKSNPSMAVIYGQTCVFAYLIFTVLRLIFFGQLRVAEIEHAQERVWHAILETCLAFTVFRDDFSAKFVVQFAVLIFVKTFHWLAEDRVDYMERSPVITVLYHARIMGILSLISAIDSYFISYAFFTTLIRGATAQVVFGFEYAILLVAVAHIAIKYILHIHDLRSANPWENKAVYMLYAELFVHFMRTMLYLVFAVVMFRIHTLPLFVIRPFYMTIRSLQKAINDVIQSRRAINAMNNLFPLATAQELADGDNTCIICREEMTVESGAKKLPCNHIFHPNCLRSWFQRQQTCPTCRTDVLAHRTVASGRAAFGGANVQANLGLQPNFFNPMINFGNPFGPMGGFPPQNQQQQQAQEPQQGGATNQQPGPMPPQQQPNPLPAGFMPMFPFVFPPIAPPPFFGMPPPPPPFMRVPVAQPADAPRNDQSVPNAAEAQPSDATNNSQPGTSAREMPSTSGANATQPATDPSSSASQPQQPTSSMPMFGAPPMFSFPQPPTFSGFSDAEIAEMEGFERGAVEARVQALRNISVLLDAAMLQFQQYLSIISTPSFVPNPAASGNVSTGQTIGATPSASSAPESSGETFSLNAVPSSANSNEATPSPSTGDGTTDPINDEVRRRRLERFGGTAATATGQS